MAGLHPPIPRRRYGPGTVCTPCRNKRMKCSGERPTCTQCLRARTRNNEVCLYEEKLSRLAALNKTIKVLEDQIQALETIKSTQQYSRPPPYSLHHESIRQLDRTTTSPRQLNEIPSGWLNGEPPDTLKSTLITTILKYPHGLFFQHQLPRIYRAIEHPPTHPDALHPCLVNALFLIACHFSAESLGSDYQRYQAIFLVRARVGLIDSLAMADRLFHFIVASVILARWFVSKGRLVEAHHQTAAVAQFAVSCKLDQIKSALMDESPISILGFPRDPLEVGERISVFWSIFILDKVVSLASGLPTTLQDIKITTIWPAHLDDYETGRAVLSTYGSISTQMSSDDTSLVVTHDDGYSLVVKVVALLDQAARLASVAHENPKSQTLSTYQLLRGDLLKLGLRTYISTLSPRLSDARLHGRLNSALVYAYTAAHGALMELDSIGDDDDSRRNAVASAVVIARMAEEMRGVDAAVLGSAIGLTWTAACDFLIREASGQGASGSLVGYINCLLFSLRKTATLNLLYENPLQRLTKLAMALN